MRLIAVTIAVAMLTGCSEGPSGPSDAEILLRNRSAQVVAAVQIAACSASSWGVSTPVAIAAGSDRAFSVSAGCWDLRATVADGRAVEFTALELSAGGRIEVTVTN